MSKNNSSILIFYVKTVPIYTFKLVWVVLHSSVKEVFKTTYKQEQNNDILFIESF